MSEPRDRRQGQDFGIPDLDLPPPRASQSGLRAVRQGEPSPASARTAQSAARLHAAPGSERELELEDHLGPKLELETERLIAPPATLANYDRAAAFSAEDFEQPSLARAVAPVALETVWPDGKTPDRSRLLLDGMEVQRCARFGEPPQGLLAAPVYAVRVRIRRRALVLALRSLDRELARAEEARDKLLSDLVARLGPELERHPSFGRHPELLRGAAPELGRAVLAARGEIEVDPSALETLRLADQRVRALVTQSELHLRALDACDRGKLEQGTLVLAVGCTVLAGLLSWSLF